MNEHLQRIARLSPEQQALLQLRLLKSSSAGDRGIPWCATGGLAPLSFGQERLWLLNQIEPESYAYNMPKALSIRGPLRVDALRDALGGLVARHEVLRTAYVSADEGPVQVVGPVRPVELPEIDLTGVPDAGREAEMHRRAVAITSRPFDLSLDTTLRAALFRMSTDEHLLLLVNHHIATDSWSRGILFGELASLYAAAVAGTAAALPALPIQYADFAAWQRAALSGEALRPQLDYWRRQLAGAPSALDLPTDRPRPLVQTYRGARLGATFPPSLTRALDRLGRAEGATLFMTLLAAFVALLHRYTGEDDVVVGSPIAGRGRVETEGLIGFFVNTLALRTRLPGGPTFRALLGLVREVALGAYSHQDLPFEKLVEELRPGRSLSRTPVFQVMFDFHNVPRTTPAWPGLNVTPLEFDAGSAMFDLTLDVTERPEGLGVAFVYSTDLFDADTVGRMLGHFRTLLDAVATDPSRRVSDLPLLTAPERHLILQEWGRGAPISRPRCAHEPFEEQARRAPDAVAIRCGGSLVSYGALDRSANRLAHRLRALGVGPESRVAVCLGRTPELVAAVLAVWKAGGAYVPLDPTYPRDRLAFMLEDSRAPIVLTTSELAGRLPAGGVSVILLGDETWTASSDLDTPPEPLAGPENLAYVIYTSGSTGRPKGVAVPHRGPSALVDSARRTFAEGELAGMLMSTSVCFDLFVFELLAPLSCGGRIILVDDALCLSGSPYSGEVTFVNTVPSAMAELLSGPGLPASVKVVGLAGERLSEGLAARCYGLPGVARVFNLYGPTEASVYSTFLEVPRGQAEPPSIGRPVSGTRAYILDASMSPVPAGVPGELHVGGAGLARGYWDRPGLTAERFVPDPHGGRPGDRLYRTGDRCRYRPDGTIEFLGRLDYQVKVRGFRVELGEIESALGRHPRVRGAVVVLRDGPGGDARLVAYVLPHGDAPTGAELRDWCRRSLPDPMVPAAFVVLDRFPLTPGGKVDRNALREPEDAPEEEGDAYVAPRTPVEELLEAIWAEVLGVGQAGIAANFFDLGGHSLSATRVVSRLNAMLGVDLPMRALFESPTIADLSVVVVERLLGGADDGCRNDLPDGAPEAEP